MKIILVRHAIAAAASEPGQRDEDRELTLDGMRKFRGIVAGLRRLDVSVERILTSPLRRAEETAKILAEGLRSDAQPERCEALAPGGSRDELFAAIRDGRAVESIALVGHEPDLSHLASFLLAPERGPVALLFKKGGVCRIDVAGLLPSPNGGVLRWLMPPRALRIVGRRA